MWSPRHCLTEIFRGARLPPKWPSRFAIDDVKERRGHVASDGTGHAQVVSGGIAAAKQRIHPSIQLGAVVGIRDLARPFRRAPADRLRQVSCAGSPDAGGATPLKRRSEGGPTWCGSCRPGPSASRRAPCSHRILHRSRHPGVTPAGGRRGTCGWRPGVRRRVRDIRREDRRHRRQDPAHHRQGARRSPVPHRSDASLPGSPGYMNEKAVSHATAIRCPSGSRAGGTLLATLRAREACRGGPGLRDPRNPPQVRQPRRGTHRRSRCSVACTRPRCRCGSCRTS